MSKSLNLNRPIKIPKNIPSKQIPKQNMASLIDQWLTKGNRKMSKMEMQLSIERLSKPLKHRLMEININKLRVARLKLTDKQVKKLKLSEKLGIPDSVNRQKVFKQSKNLKLTGKNHRKGQISTTEKENTSDKNVMEKTIQTDEEAAETVNEVEHIKRTPQKDDVYHVIETSENLSKHDDNFESVKIESMVLWYDDLKPNINEPLPPIGDLKLKIVKPGSRMNDSDLHVDESDLQLDKLGLQLDKHNPHVNEPNPRIDEQHLHIDQLEPHFFKFEPHEDELKSPQYDDQQLQNGSLIQSSLITIIENLTNKNTHQYRETALSWMEYFRQDLFALSFFGFSLISCTMNWYFIY